MVNKKFMKAARLACESQYDSTCNIWQEQNVRDPETGKIKRVKIMTAHDQPCRLSHNSPSASTTRPLPEAEQNIELFLAPEIKVEPGATIEVTQGFSGKVVVYTCASRPDTYYTHQEITLEAADKKIGKTKYMEVEDGQD